MQSNDSGFRRLSQTPLSRPRFLRLAAGALLPFVGSHQSAVAAPNSELTQNSGPPGTKDAAAPGRMGTILVSQCGPVKIHSYLSPAEGLHVNTQMVEGPNAVVISTLSSCYPMPMKLRHMCRRSASPSIGSFSRMRIPITGAVFRF
jgi:hypothetical protein